MPFAAATTEPAFTAILLPVVVLTVAGTPLPAFPASTVTAGFALATTACFGAGTGTTAALDGAALGTAFGAGLASAFAFVGLTIALSAEGPLPVDPRDSFLLPIAFEERGLDLRAWSLERFFLVSARLGRAGMGRDQLFSE